jgi:hypothetical protein
MPELSPPTVRVHRSFLAAMDEFRGEGRGGPADVSMIGSEIRDFGHRWSLPDGLAAYVDWLRSQVLEDSPRPDGYVRRRRCGGSKTTITSVALRSGIA